MKEWIFISDFDGTLTHKDFYWMVIDKYIPEKGRELFKRWKQGEFTDAVFLGMVFAAMDRSEEEIDRDIAEIPVDDHMEELVRGVQSSGGDFLILSAGTGYYIDKILKARHMEDVRFISNPGFYENRGIQMRPDASTSYYSERYGVDKEKVVLACKEQYRRVYYAGDSGPDLRAAMHADLAFAKNQLQELLARENHPYLPFSQMSEVIGYLRERGVLK
ncbi:MAG TPA: MtnX-like HAD-IB family phosphatase [Bacillota bacterium]|nr:MtnX-like HAD-IB family phosphatase [Bacillota bacterium]